MSASSPLRVMIAHNYYQQRGGEDTVAAVERDLLLSRGHPVEMFTRHNDDLAAIPKAKAAADTIWSQDTVRRFDAAADAFRPDVLHVHNSFPLISPSIYWAAARRGIAVVQTTHNYRLVCPQASFLRDGRLCEDCLGRLPWPGVVHACYRGSRTQSAVLATMLGVHRAMGTYQKRIHRYIALTGFSRGKLIEGGLPADRIAVKPNFMADPGEPGDAPRAGGLFVGRLSEEKGIATLVAALSGPGALPLRVAGTGPLDSEVAAAFGTSALGALKAEAVREEMRRAAYLVVPSIWYEGFPLVIVEAFANGLPVIASRIGSLADIVEDGRTGLLVTPGDPQDLRRATEWAAANPAAMAEMGANARRTYLDRFAPETNYRSLVSIYDEALSVSASPARA